MAGRPPFYNSPEEMQVIIDKFFKSCEGHPYIDDAGETVFDKNGNPIIVGVKPPTVTGLCLALGFSTRDALIYYAEKDIYSDTIARAKMRCHEYAESRLYDKDGANGAKFSLSNNFGWIDRQEITNNINVDIELLTAEDRRARMIELLSKKPIIEALPTTTYSVLPEKTDNATDNE